MNKDQQGGVEIVSMDSLLSEKIGEDNFSEDGEVKTTNLSDLLPDDKDDIEKTLSVSKDLEVVDEESSLKEKEDILKETTEAVGEKKDSEKHVAEQSEDSEKYRQALKHVFGNKIKTVVQEIDGEEVEVSIDDMDIDLETFNLILKEYTEQEKEEAVKGKVSVEGVSEFTKELIEIERKGGKVADLFQMKQEYGDPLDNLDLTKIEDQRTAVYLRLKAKERTDEEITNNIRAWESQGLLEDKAIEADSELRQAMQKQIELRKQQSDEAIVKRQETEKNYKKDLKTELQAQFELTDNIRSKIVDLSTKKDEKHGFGINGVYAEKMQNPKTAAELILFLLDREEFVKQITNKKLTESKLETARKIRIIKTAETSKAGTSVKGKSEGAFSLASLQGEKV